MAEVEIGFVITIAFIALFVFYTHRKAKYLRLLGYDFVYYYMKRCASLKDYYRNPQAHLSSVYLESYKILDSNRNKWFLSALSKNKIETLISFYNKASSLTTEISPYFSLDHYFAYSEHLPFIPRAEELEDMMKSIVNYEFKKYVFEKYHDEDFKNFPNGKQYTHRFSELRDEHNKEFVEKELKDNKAFFDTLFKYPLDKQQRESIVKLEDNCLVISSAGSGKTSSSIAKVKYLLEKRHLAKEEILVLSYNRKTAEEFQERLNVPELTCKTFHALALSIIGKAEGKRPDVAEDTLLLECYYQLIKNKIEFKEAVTSFYTERSSLIKPEHSYENGKDYYEDREAYGIMAPYGDMKGNPVYTRSEEERKICTWLTTHGVDFLYEQPYLFDTGNENRRQYKPDFTIYFEQNGEPKYLVLEHFGIDKNGNVPVWFGEGVQGGFARANAEYHEGISWKRRVHAEHNVALIETTSAMFHDGTVFEHLKNDLQRFGIPCNELSTEEKYARLIERNPAMEDNVMNLFSSFINLMKSNDKTFDSIMESIIQSGQDNAFCKRSRYLMYKIIKPLYDKYENTLKENGQMDFTDLILHAAEICNSGKYKSPYSYILVDEFQDISVDRYKFIQSLRKEAPFTKTYCVGDDWQSIYRFSGSDMNLFNKFDEYFGFTETCKIETTYRFGNPLVSKSSTFILANPSQKKKEVQPLSDNVVTNLSFIPFKRDERGSYLPTIKEVLDSIPEEESVMLLGRYNHEVNVFPQNCIERTPNSRRAKVTYNGRTMNFMSVHAAKGLEADHVLILNCSQDRGGFPSRVADDPILGYVLSEIDSFEYSEERRLFYVAITRAKKHTHVLYNIDMPSVFVTEMENDENEQMLCPVCKKGRFKKVKEGPTSTGGQYQFYLCSNSVAGCRNKWMVYFNAGEELNPLPKYHRQMDSFFNPAPMPDFGVPMPELAEIEKYDDLPF